MYLLHFSNTFSNITIRFQVIYESCEQVALLTKSTRQKQKPGNADNGTVAEICGGASSAGSQDDEAAPRTSDTCYYYTYGRTGADSGRVPAAGGGYIATANGPIQKRLCIKRVFVDVLIRNLQLNQIDIH